MATLHLPVESKGLSWKEKSLEDLKTFSTKNKLSASTENSSILLKKKEIIEKKLALQLDQIKKLQKEIDEIKAEDNDEYIQQKYNFYLKITNLTFDLQSLPTEVKGYISKPFRMFNLNAEIYSEFEISNHLWKLISGEEESLTDLL